MTQKVKKINAAGIKLISFDFWETLYNDLPEVEGQRNRKRMEMLHDFCNRKGKNIDLANLNQTFDEVHNIFKKFVSRGPHRTFSLYDLVFQTARTCGFDTENKFLFNEIDALAIEIDRVCLDYPPVLSKDAKEIIPYMAGKFSLAIISNTEGTTGKTLRKLMINDGIFKYFQKFSFSDEVGVTKPNPAIFHQTINYFEIEPLQTVHVGDSLQNDYYGAINVGVNAVYLNSAQDPTPQDTHTILSLSELLEIIE